MNDYLQVEMVFIKCALMKREDNFVCLADSQEELDSGRDKAGGGGPDAVRHGHGKLKHYYIYSSDCMFCPNANIGLNI